MKTEWWTVTPAYALELLEKNSMNRPHDRATVARLAGAMANGTWQEKNGDTLCFADDMTVIDGQHRLRAVVAYGHPVSFLVVLGVPKEAFKTKDRGRRRTSSDTLAVLGEKNTASLAATLGMVEWLLAGRVVTDGNTPDAVEGLLAKHPDARASVAFCHGIRSRLVSPSMMAALHCLFARKDPQAADQFVRDVLQGANLPPHDGALLLRNRLVENLKSKSKLEKLYVGALAIKAWNARRTGAAVRCLKYGDHEEFPRVL